MGAGRGAGSLGYGLKPTGWQVLRFPRSAGWGQAPAVRSPFDFPQDERTA